ncbi:MAG: hypothetical protein EOP11_19645, partial [Proteobacteria bacterium]
MRSRALFLFLLLTPLRAFAAEGAFCLQTFNVYGPAYASDTKWRIGQAAKAIARDGCEIVQLQELWQKNQFAILENKLSPSGWAGLWADPLRGDQALIGLGTFVKGSISQARSALYRANNGDGLLDRVRGLSGVQKGYTLIEASAAGSPAFLLINTHTHPTHEPTRLVQLLQLTEAIYEDPAAGETPLLFTADINATPKSLEYAILRDLLLLRDGYAEANGGYGEECTYCAKNRYSWSREDRVIDFTLHRSGPRAKLHARNSGINLRGQGNPLSDHFGVRTEIEWEDRADEGLDASDDILTSRKRAAEDTLEAVLRALDGNPDSRLADGRAWARGFLLRL